ncbi:Patellin-4 [Apostasia shenzhenica]|uniref:Patellin-4 n=1 Tax=Apostasia shenzhenica TaxID=1088818 RepID=A0A2I0AQN4_9ASPA|nr:Patellin-4 [Apostasia shenzhenica]
MTTILDVEGLSWTNVGKLVNLIRDIVIRINKIDSNNYPEMLSKMFIVNAGHGFRLLWNALKGFVDPRTSAKIVVLGCAYQRTLLEYIDISQLPDFFGGYCTCENEGGCLRSNKGPWSDPEIMKLVHDNQRSLWDKTTQFDEEKCDLVVKSPLVKYDDYEIQSELILEDALSPRRSRSSPHTQLTPFDLETVASNNLDNQPSWTTECRRIFLFSWLVNFIMSLLTIIHRFITTGSLVHDFNELLHQQHNLSSISLNHIEQHHPQVNEDSIHSYLERLQRLEDMVSDLNKKPTTIPPEKDHMIQESLNRIRSIEHDLRKTKDTLTATSIRQDELAESLEHIKETGLQRKSCWPNGAKYP